VLALLSVTLLAKGPTSRIVLAGAGLPHPVEITDPALLKDFQVWSGPGTVSCVQEKCVEGTTGFIIDWSSGPVSDRPAGLPRYEVSFYATDRRAPHAERLVYVVSYEYDASSSRGYVYLPGKDDPQYALNTRSIHRGREGKWFRATAAWDEVVRGVLGGR
jgi:hypothetical protein